MEATQMHLALNHFPIVGMLFGITLLAWGFFAKNKSLEHAGLIGMVVMALITIPVFLSGQGAEHYVEEFPGVSHELIHEHEELGEKAFYFMLLVGGLALASLVMSLLGKRKAVLNGITLALAFGAVALLGNTAAHGGKIMHKELHPAADQATSEH